MEKTDKMGLLRPIANDTDMCDVMAANEKVEHYSKMITTKQKELDVLKGCLERGVIFPVIKGERPLYCSEEAISEELGFYQRLYQKATNQRDILWQEHTGEAFEYKESKY